MKYQIQLCTTKSIDIEKREYFFRHTMYIRFVPITRNIHEIHWRAEILSVNEINN